MPGLGLPIAFVPRAAHGLPGRLGFAPAPGRWPRQADPGGDAVQEDLRRLSLACGEVVLVTLLEEGEMERLGLSDLLDRASRSGFECLWFPIPDGTAPANLEETALLVARMLERLAAGRTVIVHCLGGVGRSGTIAACALVGAGRDPRGALELVRAGRAAAATAPGQEAFVYEFARACTRGTDTPPPDAPRGGR